MDYRSDVHRSLRLAAQTFHRLNLQFNSFALTRSMKPLDLDFGCRSVFTVSSWPFHSGQFQWNSLTLAVTPGQCDAISCKRVVFKFKSSCIRLAAGDEGPETLFESVVLTQIQIRHSLISWQTLERNELQRTWIQQTSRHSINELQ